MPIAMLNPAIGIVAAVMLFASSIFSITPNYDVYVDRHIETKDAVIFYCKANDKSDPKVEIDKKDGSVKIKVRNKRDNIEFDLEYSGELAPQDREAVTEIMKSLQEHAKRDKTIKQRIKNYIKDFVNKKL
jgi:hypothetical protein